MMSLEVKLLRSLGPQALEKLDLKQREKRYLNSLDLHLRLNDLPGLDLPISVRAAGPGSKFSLQSD